MFKFNDLLNHLRGMAVAEMTIDEDNIEEFCEGCLTDVRCDNSYNWENGEMVNKFFEFFSGRMNDKGLIIGIKEHLGGDVRANYADHWRVYIISFNKMEAAPLVMAKTIDVSGEEYRVEVALTGDEIEAYRTRDDERFEVPRNYDVHPSEYERYIVDYIKAIDK